MVGYVREMTAKKSSKVGEHGYLEYVLLLLFCWCFVCLVAFEDSVYIKCVYTYC